MRFVLLGWLRLKSRRLLRSCRCEWGRATERQQCGRRGQTHVAAVCGKYAPMEQPAQRWNRPWTCQSTYACSRGSEESAGLQR
eukprot:185923-Pleurochrysis_carterae.AAC.6